MRLQSLIFALLSLLFVIESRAVADVVVQKPKDTIFHVRSQGPRYGSAGSGFATKRNGKMVIITATHVVKESPTKEAVITGVNYPTSITVRFTVWEGDVCYAEVTLPDGWAWIGTSAKSPSVGDACGAWGFPHDQATLAGFPGVVATDVALPSMLPPESHYLHINGIVIEGMSGGPLVNRNGEVIGIVSYKQPSEWFSATLPK